MLKIYKASAGSGKTYQLTKDYIFMLFNKLIKQQNATVAPHRKVLAVTFTNKATEEMKTRIVAELYKLSSSQPSGYRAELATTFHLSESEVDEKAKTLLVLILHDYSGFSISTIDKFFQQIIRSFAREIGVNGGFNIELDSDMILKQAVDNLLSSLVDDENKQLMSWISDYVEERIDDGNNWKPQRDLLKLGQQIFNESYQSKADLISEKLKDKDFLKRYKEQLYVIKTGFEKELEYTARETIQLLEKSGMQPEYFKSKLMFSTLENISNGKYEFSATFRKYGESVENCYTKTQTQGIKTAIETLFSNGLSDNLQKIFHLIENDIIAYNSAKVILGKISVLGILSDISDEINTISQDQNLMLISNTNMFIRKIIDESETPFVYERMGMRLHNYMIDEFQDTSTLQWDNFKPLIRESLANGNENMLVGDVKQSIYRWRNSDWKLLDQQVYKDFNPQQINAQTLDTNWRSDKHIVAFNNAFFEFAAERLQDVLNEELETSNAPADVVNQLNNKIVNAYSSLRQKVSSNAGEGYVKVEFIPDSKKVEEWHEAVLEKLPHLLENLVDRGYRPSDIGFLVRKNREAVEITNYLMNYKTNENARPDFSYKVIGKEGLKLNASPSVKFLISLVKLAHLPTERVNRLRMNYEFLRNNKQLSNDEALSQASQTLEEEMIGSSLFSDEQNASIESLKHLSLYEAVEQIINVFDLAKTNKDTVFIQAFQDVVFKFQSSNSSDLNSFIEWWNEKEEKLTVSTPDEEDAFRIMTVHSAKGLDFKVVIAPFCDWKLVDNKGSLLWCEPKVEPYNQLPLLPIEFSSTLNKSIFRSEYFTEKMQQYMDAMNIGYVAFTRARNEMYCFAPLATKVDKAPSHFAEVLLQSFCISQQDDTLSLREYFDTETSVFEIGMPTNFEYEDKSVEIESVVNNDYPTTTNNGRLKIKNIGTEIWLKELPIEESRLNYGLLLHDVLKKTLYFGDDKKVVEELHRNGTINDAEKQLLTEELDKFWEKEEVRSWFDADADLLTERAILLPSGNQYRPDRVVIKNGVATVIDYKFGEQESASYIRQVERYIHLINEMGYKTKGYIYYVSLGKIVAV